MDRDITRANLTEVVSRGLERSGGNYRGLVSLFNMPQSDYKRFLTFLTSHRCHVRFQAFRSLPDRNAIGVGGPSGPVTPVRPVGPVRPLRVDRREGRTPQAVGF
jgi:hypothetical protein